MSESLKRKAVVVFETMKTNDKIRKYILILVAVSLIMAGVGYQFTIANSFVMPNHTAQSTDASFIQTLPMLLISTGKVAEEKVTETNYSIVRNSCREKTELRSAWFLILLAVFGLYVLEKLFFIRNRINKSFVHSNSVMVADYVHLFDGCK